MEDDDVVSMTPGFAAKKLSILAVAAQRLPLLMD
jgi:hypothetical protein